MLAGSSQNLGPEDRLVAMRFGVDYRAPINVRGFKVFVRPISNAEQLQLYVDVAVEMQKLPEAARNPITEHTLVAKKTLAMASTSKPDKFDFQLNDEMLNAMTFDELTFLFKQYVLVCEKVNPAFEELSDEEIDRLVEVLKKSPEAVTDLSTLQLINVCRRISKG